MASCSPQFSPSRPCRPSCPFHRLLLWPDPSLCACFLVASLVLFSQARKALILWPSWSVPCPSWLSAALQPCPWAPRLLSFCLPTCLCLHWALCFAGTSVHTHRLAAPQDEVRWSCLSGAEPLAQGNLCLADMQTLIQTVFVKCSPGFWALRVKGKAPLESLSWGQGAGIVTEHNQAPLSIWTEPSPLHLLSGSLLLGTSAGPSQFHSVGGGAAL